jgi:hypothetical protein
MLMDSTLRMVVAIDDEIVQIVEIKSTRVEILRLANLLADREKEEANPLNHERFIVVDSRSYCCSLIARSMDPQEAIHVVARSIQQRGLNSQERLERTSISNIGTGCDAQAK